MKTLLGLMAAAGFIATAAAQTLVEDENRVTAIRVELAWLAEPSLCCYHPRAKVVDGKLRATGYLPNDELRAKTLLIASRIAQLPVIDEIKVHPACHFSHAKVNNGKLIKNAARTIQSRFPSDYRNWQLGMKAPGQLVITGSIDSYEKKLMVSQRLRMIQGCRCVLNQLQVETISSRSVSTPSVSAPKTAPGATPSKVVAAQPISTPKELYAPLRSTSKPVTLPAPPVMNKSISPQPKLRSWTASSSYVQRHLNKSWSSSSSKDGSKPATRTYQPLPSAPTTSATQIVAPPAKRPVVAPSSTVSVVSPPPTSPPVAPTAPSASASPYSTNVSVSRSSTVTPGSPYSTVAFVTPSSAVTSGSPYSAVASTSKTQSLTPATPHPTNGSVSPYPTVTPASANGASVKTVVASTQSTPSGNQKIWEAATPKETATNQNHAKEKHTVAASIPKSTVPATTQLAPTNKESQIQQLIQNAGGPAMQLLKCEISGQLLKIHFLAPNEGEADRLADIIMSMPALASYRLELQVDIPN